MRYLMKVAAVLFFLCPNVGNADEPPAKSAASPALTGLPIKMTVKQRSTTVVPGTNGAIELTIDDITRGQVMASLAKDDGTTLIARRSFATGKSKRFRLGEEEYALKLKQLHNALIGQDFADFVVDRPGPPLSEQEKIEQLILFVVQLQAIKIIRNDEEHTPLEAAEHLRKKWERAGKDKLTAVEFIEQIASKSSLTGKPYELEAADGKKVMFEQVLKEQLKQIELDQ